MLPLLVLLGTFAGAWYLLIVRPQKEQQTRHGQLVDRLQVGDHVLTVGGIYGRVVAVEGPSVVLELAPGLTSRIATDGIARIVHAGDALPSAPAQAPRPQEPPKALDTAMHQHPQPDQQQAPQQQLAPPQYRAPAQPWGAQTAQPLVQLQAPAPPAPAPNTAGYEPRPWGDLAPVNHAPAAPAQAQYAIQPAAVPQYAAPQGLGPQYAAPHGLAPQYAAQPAPVQHAPQHHHPSPPSPAASIPSPPPLPMPLVRPFAHAAPATGGPVAAPMYHAAQHAPVQPAQPVQYAQPPVQPGVQPHLVPAHLATTHAPHPAHAAAPATPQQPEQTRRHSRAPQGMGSSLRLDDPSLSDAVSRARDERAELADEYRKLTAPLVDVGTAEHAAPPQRHPAAAELQAPPGTAFVGHDPNGVPLYAAPGSPTAHPVAQYPGPARPEHATAMPRPVVQSHGTIDPALSSSAFQRRTPYAPDPALQQQGTPQVAQPALA